ncbi:GNAT family N-acetyltransferase [Mesorhizobium sp. ORM16]|uniref:GNAT family N-acetyltransferase n=1 Tax=Mesorhizobium sp. ORM16 TaxID=3376989 RepID=UPI003857202B
MGGVDAFVAMLGEWVLSGYGMFAVQLKETGSVVGLAGLWHPYSIDEPELAWRLYAGFDGRGGSRAARAGLDRV